MLCEANNEMDCVGIEVSNTVHFFVSEGSCVELATAEHMGRSDVTPWMKLQLAHHPHDEKDV